ncbi:hypothetical protein C8Q79DRAFT_1013320 [Trametes meyenii]|nr:hypothetical protein C8Q79DRAFT_1013320 [Trametes meyenii]
MATTGPRSFIVFKDEPEVAPAPVVDRKENHNGQSATYVLAPPPGPQLVYAPDKENIDPMTGTRVLGEQASGKKRKTALTVKAQAASPTKRLKPLAEKPTKKTVAKSRGSEKKTKRVASKRAVPSRVHREPSLPRVTEETESADQAVIDSKCKDLTVLPLADISEAYDVSPPKEKGATAVGTPRVAQEDSQSKEVAQVQPERPATPQATKEASPSPAHPPTASSVFSTPDRKRIYSAFTFTSPSPAGKRCASARASSVDRFSDAAP